ncbi:DUF503 domain-containing protein [Mucisphaera sp.]|uniref:DUF503 domain-containing protein n=1 Tax=Mucisphaera sp. TaxID=2913024 RepID=UPI003D0B28FD
MVVGILQLELTIEGAVSLKDKRRVVRSLKDRLHHDHRVSVAEVGHQDVHQTALLGVALASSDVTTAQSVLDKLVDRIRIGRGYVLSDHRIEILSGQ